MNSNVHQEVQLQHDDPKQNGLRRISFGSDKTVYVDSRTERRNLWSK
jgi:hypothetical protein